LAFRHYRNGNENHPIDAYFTGEPITLHSDPILAMSIGARGGALVVTSPHGVLATRAAGAIDVLLGDGVAYIGSPGGGRPALLAWTSSWGVSWDVEKRLLEMTESYGARGRVTLLVHVEDSIDVFTASEKDDDDDSIWARQIFRIRGWSAAGQPKCYLYSESPVRREYWPYVISSSMTESPDEIEWTVQFQGNVEAVFSLSVTDPRLVDAAAPVHSEKSCGVAIWPPKLIPGWRLYSVVGDLVFDRPGNRIDFWLGNAGSRSCRLAASDEVITSKEGIAIVPRDGAGGPRFLQVVNGEAVGYFELLSESCAQGEQGTSVGIDFGTSATTVAVAEGGQSVAIDLGSYNLMAHPKIIVPNHASGLHIDPVWLPTIVSPMFSNVIGDLKQIPTGVFKRLTDDSPAGALPFVGFTFVSGNFDLNLAPERVRGWTADLKWRRDNANGASGMGAGDADRRKFFVAILTWTAALLREHAGRIDLRATYPLAFTSNEVKAYGSMLKEVAAQVEKMTGIQISIARPYFGLDAEEQAPRPFVDESTPLLDGALTHFNVVGAKGQPVIFVADLGGETLDVQLVCLPKADNDSSYRIVACESVRIGANAIVDYLQNELIENAYRTNDPADQPKIVRSVLNRVIRSQQLAGAIAAGQTVPIAGTRISWRSPRAPQDFLHALDGYFGLLVEYCARFVSGTLRNRTGLRTRLATAPGLGVVSDEFLIAPTITYAIQPYLIGNGWKMLPLFLESISGSLINNPSAWIASILLNRIGELLSPEQVELVEGSPGAPLFMDKTQTAIGTVRLGESEPPRSGQIAPVLASPNGYADSTDGTPYSWDILVGPGGEDVRGVMQNDRLLQPPLPDPAKLTITGAGSARFKRLIIGQGLPSRKDDLIRVRKLQESQSTGNTQGRREVSAARAAWETVLRPQLLD